MHVLTFNPIGGEIAKYRKEDRFSRQISVVDLDRGREVLCARWYNTPARTYCCVWLWNDAASARGGAYADGYGYHRGSAALEAALSSAGVTLSEPIGGVGDSAEREALEALARHLGVNRPLLVFAHP